MEITEFMINCEKGLRDSKDSIITDIIDKVIITGTGTDIIPGYMINLFLKNNKIPVEVSEGYADENKLTRKTLLIILSREGDDEVALSHYRLASRKDSIIMLFNSGGKLKSISNCMLLFALSMKEGSTLRILSIRASFPIIRKYWRCILLSSISRLYKFTEDAKSCCTEKLKKLPFD